MKYRVELRDQVDGTLKTCEIESDDINTRTLCDIMNYAHWPKNFSVDLVQLRDADTLEPVVVVRSE